MSARWVFKSIVCPIAILSAALLVVGCANQPDSPATPEVAAAARFPGVLPDVGGSPTPGWEGHVFELSQDYPTALPVNEPAPWEAIDFRTEPRAYLMAVRDYVYEGNIDRGVDANGNSLDWNTQTNPVRVWTDMPWRAETKHGREFVRGLTMEFPSSPGSLDPNQTEQADTWARAMYSPIAGYTVGRVWPDPEGAPVPENALFGEGAVVVKILFTTAEGIPEVEDAYRWEANIYLSDKCEKLGCEREVQPVSLFQMDVAIKDSRAEQTAWVFGTFVYDHNSDADSVWDKMVPLGLSWGNDPELTSGSNQEPEESIIFQTGLPQHLGCHGRLSGPLDNIRSACMSCHMASQTPGANSIPDRNFACDAPQNAKFWRNILGSVAFDPSATETTYPLDYSMEMASSIQNYLSNLATPTFSEDGSTFTRAGSETTRQTIRRQNMRR